MTHDLLRLAGSVCGLIAAYCLLRFALLLRRSHEPDIRITVWPFYASEPESDERSFGMLCPELGEGYKVVPKRDIENTEALMAMRVIRRRIGTAGFLWWFLRRGDYRVTVDYLPVPNWVGKRA